MAFGLSDWLIKNPETGVAVRLPRKGSSEPRPFLQWVGGKREMLSLFPNILPHTYKKYHEPFLGGGAMLFHLKPEEAFVNDSNVELIRTYRAVAENVEEVIALLTLFKTRHSKELYLKTRALDRSAEDFHQFTDAEIAARLIYLNQTGFNGVYRVNKKGQYNVPIGSSLNKVICDPSALRAASGFLNGYHFSSQDFHSAIDHIDKGDFMYLDPPYVPVSEYSDFTRYTKDQFGEDDQVRVHHLFSEANDKGCKVLLSNSDTSFIRELYKDFKITTITSSRNLNSHGMRRGHVNEVLVANYEVAV